MALRRLLLRGMLGSLAAAALAGVVAVFVGDADVMGRVVGTAIVTAAACGLLMPIAALTDRPPTRVAGLVGITAVVVEFLLALLLIWEIPRRLLGLRWEGEIAATMLLGAAASALAVGLLRLRGLAPQRIAGDIGLGVVVAAFTASMIGVWMPLPNRVAENWFETAWAVFACGALLATALAGYAPGRIRPWPAVGALSAIGALLLWLTGIWTGIRSPAGTVAFAGLLCCAGVVALASLLRHCPLPATQRWLPRATVAAAALEAGLIELLVVRDQFWGVTPGFDIPGRLTAACGIATACGTLATLVLSRIGRRTTFEPTASDLASLTVVCPRCGKRQTLAVGNAQCRRCGLRIAIRIEEPRCRVCGYLLYGLSGGRCPECGTPVQTPEPQAGAP